MKVDKIQVFNFEGATRGMRNPLNSWHLSDSFFGYAAEEQLEDLITKCVDSYFDESKMKEMTPEALDTAWQNMYDYLKVNGCKKVYSQQNVNIYEVALIGFKDYRLMRNLIKSGSEHSKFLRQILVSFDISATRSWWSEFDTYHFNTKNSCSTMHKLFDKKHIISVDDFEHENDERIISHLKEVVSVLNSYREIYLNTEDKELKNEILIKAKAILPESYLQKRTVTTNYAEIFNIIHQREFHTLPYWRYFCTICKHLPYMKLLRGEQYE